VCRTGSGACSAGIGACQRTGAWTCGDDGALLSARGNGEHTCVVMRDRSVRCWGANSGGQLGDGSSTDRPTAAVTGGTTFNDITQLATGRAFSCARRSTGALSCWGANTYGQLGNNSTSRTTSPVAVTGITDAIEVAAGADFTCARLSSGGARCWGRSNRGQSASGSTTGSLLTPQVVLQTGSALLTDVVDIDAGDGHACAVLRDGRVFCWGENANWQTGSSDVMFRTLAREVTGVTGAVEVATGATATCARLANGTVQCWGGNAYGQLGNGGTTASATPVVVSGLTNAAQLVAAADTFCARRGDGSVWCWGDGRRGQIGNGVTASVSSATATITVTNAAHLGGGHEHFCAVLPDSGVRCWGRAAEGQIGNNMTRDMSAPQAALSVSVAGTFCAATLGTPAVETCNNLDDDCNGVIDDAAMSCVRTNLARGRSTSASTTYNTCFPSSVITNGVTNGNYSSSGGCPSNIAYTNTGIDQWMQVDLGSVRSIDRVVLYGRSDCCPEVSSPLTVRVSQDGTNFTTVATNLSAQSGVTANFSAVSARYVRVVRIGTGYLSLAEVEVY
jgi:alpha-tubulin suppressor-like RCC1 family protein